MTPSLPPSLLSTLTEHSGVYRLILTALVVVAAAFLIRLVHAYYTRQSAEDYDARRLSITTLRNAIVACAALLVLGIWLTEIRSVAISVAAVGAGILLVSKELLMCGMGSMIRATTKPYVSGDVIEIGGLQGKVISYNFLTTTLLERGPGEQFTGRVASFPNSLLLTHTLKNTATRSYSIEFLKVPVAASADLPYLAEQLRAAGEDTCQPFMDHAAKHFSRLEGQHFIKLPSATPTVFFEHKDAKEVLLLLRYPSSVDRSSMLPQEILLAFYTRVRRLPEGA